MEFNKVIITEIINIATIHSEKGRMVEMKNRQFYGLSLCIDGQITYSHKGKIFVSDKDHAIILPEGQSYSLKGDQTGDFPLINFHTLHPICDTFVVMEIRNRELLLKTYEEIKKLSLNESNQAKLFSLFYDMLHELSTQNDIGELNGAIKYIYDNYHIPSITNSKLAEECKISEVYFRKLFKQRFGISPRQFIIDLRIQKAKQLLCEGTQKIWAIAESCGFSSAYHFCRVFKERTGMTPHDYRRQNQIFEF